LAELAARVSDAAGNLVPAPCDVSNRQQVERVAEIAVEQFGRIDTWINNAGLGMYTRIEEASDADNRRLFDVNFWGVVYGSLAVLPRLRQHGGALINVGSEVSDAVAPLLGMYAASKHAVKGFTDALRVEVEDVDRAPLSITLIQPTAVDTAFPRNARNYLDREPKLPEPMLDPWYVAEAILKAAVTPTRNVNVGFRATINTAMYKFAPAWADLMAARQLKELKSDEPPRNPQGAFHLPSEQAQAEAAMA
jgi:short-subunit dehydrogenase